MEAKKIKALKSFERIEHYLNMERMKYTIVPGATIEVKYEASRMPIVYKIIDVLNVRKAEKLYADKLGYSFFDNIDKELIKAEKAKKVVILENQNNVISYDYFDDFLNNNIKYKII